MTIPDAASCYLRGESAYWLAFCHLYLSEWFEWLAEVLHTNVEEIRFSSCAEEFCSLMLRPDFIREISRCRTNVQANQTLKERCSVLLAHSDAVTVARRELDDPFDQKIVIVDPGEDSYRGIDDGFAYPIRSVNTSTFKCFFNGVSLKRSSPDKLADDHGLSILSLDVVDVALYKTLLQHPELLRSLHWRTFEKLLADILDSFGYEIELQRGTKDGGIDIFALKKGDAFGAQRYLIQAKRWSNKVGIEPVQQLLFLHNYHKVTKSCLATTATFTRGAWELADQYRWQLELRDFDGIQEWLRLAGRKRQGG